MASPAPARDAALTKARLLQSALDLIASRGYHPTKVSDIVARAGVSQAAFYLYFKSKLDIALDLVVNGEKAMLAAIGRGYRSDRVDAADMRRNSTAWLIDLLRFAENNRALFAFLLARGLGADPKLDKAISRARATSFGALKRNVGQAVQLGMLPEHGDLDIRAACVQRLIEGILDWWLFGEGYDLDRTLTFTAEQIAAQVVAFEFGGLLHPNGE